MTGQASHHPHTKEVKCPSRSRPDRPGRPPHRNPGTGPGTDQGGHHDPSPPPSDLDAPRRLHHGLAACRRLARRVLIRHATAAKPAAVGRQRPTLRRVAWGVAIVAVVLFAAAPPAAAATSPSLTDVISNLTNWIVGILAGVATLFLTIGGLRYLTAGGDPGQVEKAKIALKSAAIGYALAILAPLLVSIVTSIIS